MLKLTRLFSQLKRQHIVNSTYDQLVERIAQNYNLKEYKNQSGLCLLQMHHQFKLFNPGDWVLDIGSGKDYAWTDLALKLTQNEESTQRVISNDVLDLRKTRQNNLFIRGDINDQPVQTKIALQVENHNLNTILVDVSPPFTGNINADGRQIMRSISSVLNIAQNFLNKGGNMVCKVLQSESQPLLNESFDVYFNEKYKYVPSVMRKTSPVCFYVLKGFLMSENLYALQDFLKQYKGSPDKKIKLVEKYRGKHSWDPQKVIKKQILEDILRMRKQGRPDKDIIKVFASDPYAKAQRTIKLLQQAEQAQKDRNMVLHYKIMNQISQGQLYKNAEEMPTTAQEFYEKVVQNMQKVIKEDKQKKEEKKNKVSRSPLKQNEVYMKVEDKVKQRQEIKKQYFKGDLEGKYSGGQSSQQIQEQISKIQKVHPEISRLMNEMEEASKDTSEKTIEEILQQNKHRQQELSVQKLRNIQETIEQSIKNMTSSQVEEQRRLEREIYRRDLNEQREYKADRYVNQRRSKRKKPLF